MFINASSASVANLSPYELDLQALELWADSKAVTLTLRRFLRDSVGDDQLDKWFPEPKQRLFLWSFAMFTLFRIWGIGIDPDCMHGDHPPTAMRFEILMQSAIIDTAELRPELEKDFMGILHQAQNEAERAIAYCGGERLLPDDVIDIRHPLVMKRREELLKHFDDVLLPELKKHSRVSLHTSTQL